MPAIECGKQEGSFSGREGRWMIAGAIRLAVLTILAATQMQAQTFTTLHNFAGNDGSEPEVGLTMDRPGNLYGTTSGGGTAGYGTVFKLTRQGTGWTLKPLYNFSGGSDGAVPISRVIFGPDGSLYGTTFWGGLYGVGAIYKLQPPQSACKTAICPWTETVLYNFTGQSDGFNPEGDLIFDQDGHIYGTDSAGAGGGCYDGCGVVYQLSRVQGSWNLNVLHTFTGFSDGGLPASGVILDAAANLYGTAVTGGYHSYGLVFELTPGDSGWTETVLHTFMGGNDGSNPEGGLVFDGSGNLYGVTIGGGDHNNGTAFELQAASGGWNYAVLYNLGLQSGQPIATPVLDSAGNLYGTAYSGGQHNAGAVYELNSSGESWNYISLHDFTISDGEYPQAGVILDTQGNVYGTTTHGGANQIGTVWEITPN